MQQRLVIDNWHPARLNSWDGRHWSVRARAKKFDRDLIGLEAIRQGIVKANGPRRVSLLIVLGKGQRGPDPDSLWKSTNDALVAAGLLVQDDRFHVELGTVTFSRGQTKRTEIVLEDVDD